MSLILYALYASLNLGLLAWGLSLWWRTKKPAPFLIALVTFGLVYDNFILLLGGFMSGGPLLFDLSVPRFVLHQLVLPWIMLAAFYQVRRLGFPWAQRDSSRWIIIGLCLLVALLGALTRLAPMDLQLVEMGGISRYMNEGVSGPPIVSIVSIGFAGVMGFLIWRRQGWPWLFLTAALVFIGEGIPSELVRRVLGSGAEVLFIAAMLQSERRLSELPGTRPDAGDTSQS